MEAKHAPPKVAMVADILKEGISRDEAQSAYDQWAGQYETVLTNAGYQGPRVIAEALAEKVPQETRAAAKVLDIGAGTGQVGQEVRTSMSLVQPAGASRFNSSAACFNQLLVLLP